VKTGGSDAYSTGSSAARALCSGLSHVPVVRLDDHSVIERQMFHVEQSLEPKV